MDCMNRRDWTTHGTGLESSLFVVAGSRKREDVSFNSRARLRKLVVVRPSMSQKVRIGKLGACEPIVMITYTEVELEADARS